MDINSIIRPTLVLDKAICYKNIENMCKKAEASGVRLRPHFKTHQSKLIGEYFRKSGVSQITVSSVQMAHYFADDGWDDIVIAFPLNPREIDDLSVIAKNKKICVVVSNLHACEIIVKNIDFSIDVYLEVDTGYHRSGFDSMQMEEIVKAVDILKSNSNIRLIGFLSHFGNSYNENARKIQTLWDESILRLKNLKNSDLCFKDFMISVGDTPCCTVVMDLSEADEIRPGNFVFYDVMQVSKGICSSDEIAVAVFCPVVDIHPERNEFIIYGGAIHLSKEFVTYSTGEKIYGLISAVHEKGWSKPVEGVYIKSLSQEHGIVHGTSDYIQTLKIGDLVAVLPVHSCLTAQCFSSYRTTENEIFDHM